MLEKFRYRGAAYHGQGDTLIVLEFERAEGIPFEMALPIADAERLQGDLKA
jgi:hypothetical protein